MTQTRGGLCGGGEHVHLKLQEPPPQSPPLVCVIVPSSSSFSFPDGQSRLIGLNGPPDIPVVLENLPQITAAAYELGLHVEPIGRRGEGGGAD
jgi:hypothetical protein